MYLICVKYYEKQFKLFYLKIVVFGSKYELISRRLIILYKRVGLSQIYTIYSVNSIHKLALISA
jgi:hypothetical protein